MAFQKLFDRSCPSEGRDPPGRESISQSETMDARLGILLQSLLLCFRTFITTFRWSGNFSVKVGVHRDHPAEVYLMIGTGQVRCYHTENSCVTCQEGDNQYSSIALVEDPVGIHGVLQIDTCAIFGCLK